MSNRKLTHCCSTIGCGCVWENSKRYGFIIHEGFPSYGKEKAICPKCLLKKKHDTALSVWHVFETMGISGIVSEDVLIKQTSKALKIRPSVLRSLLPSLTENN